MVGLDLGSGYSGVAREQCFAGLEPTAHPRPTGFPNTSVLEAVITQKSSRGRYRVSAVRGQGNDA